MFTPSSKYFGEQDERHQGTLHWPGVHGIPFRGSHIPNLKQRELDQLPIVAHACHQTFDLSDPEQAAVYQWVRDRIRNGLFTLDFIERWKNEGGTNMRVYLEWSQLYVQTPPQTALGSNGNGSPDSFTLRST